MKDEKVIDTPNLKTFEYKENESLDVIKKYLIAWLKEHYDYQFDDCNSLVRAVIIEFTNSNDGCRSIMVRRGFQFFDSTFEHGIRGIICPKYEEMNNTVEPVLDGEPEFYNLNWTKISREVFGRLVEHFIERDW